MKTDQILSKYLFCLYIFSSACVLIFNSMLKNGKEFQVELFNSEFR